MGAGSAIKAGRAVVEIFSDTTKLERGLTGASRKLGRFSAGAARAGGVLLAAGGAAAAPFAASISSASRLQETMNKFDVVFGQNAGAVKQWGDNFAAQVGRSKEQTASFLAGTQDLFVPLGFEAGAAEKMSKQITALAVDVASFNNKADADVLNDFHAALTGSGEVMKKYGVLVNQAAVNAQLLSQNIDPKTATDQQKVQARLAIIMAGTTAAQGDAIRSAGSYANQMKRLQATVDDTAASVGTALLPTVTSLVSKVSTVAQWVGNWAATNQGLIIGAAGLAAGLVVTGGSILGVAAAAKVAAVGIGLASTAVSVLGTVIGVAMSPVALITAGVVGLGVAAASHFGLIETASQKLGSAFGAVKDDALTAFGGIKASLASGDISGALGIAGAMMEVEWLRVTSSISEVWQGVKDAFGNITDSMSLKWTEFANSVGDIWDSVVNSVLTKVEKVQNSLAVAIAGAVYGEDAANTAREMGANDTRSRDRNRAAGEAMRRRADEERKQKAANAQAAQKRASASAAKAAAAQKRLADARARMAKMAGSAKEAAAAAAVQAASTDPAATSTPTPDASGRSRGTGLKTATGASTFAGLTGTTQAGVAGRLAYSSFIDSNKNDNPVPLLGQIKTEMERNTAAVSALAAGGYE